MTTQTSTQVIKDAAVTASKLATTLNLTGKTISLPAGAVKNFISANQTITAGGALTLAHGLAVMPAIVQPRLKCLTADLGYAVDDELIVSAGANGTNLGLSLIANATNVLVRFGSDAGVISIPRKDTGATAAITPASWALIVRAFV